MEIARTLFSRYVFGNPYLLLIMATLFWGGNTIAGRLAIGHVSPMVVVSLRWFIVASVLIVLTRAQLKREWPILRKALPIMAAMSLFGFVAFTSFFYIAAHHTTALNLGILQGSIPILVLIGSAFLFANKIRLLQALGVVATLVGVAIVASHGDFNALLNLRINPGDGVMMLACISYAIYTLALRNRPKIPALPFFTVLSALAAILSLPAFLYEMQMGDLQWPDAEGWLIVFYISLFPSCLAQIFFVRGVELIGPARAGVFINLVPVFAATLAVLILSEEFHLYHALSMALVLGGIGLSERKVREVPPVD
ncbi:MAG: DMT family transporter [Rhodobacteraceae bacterium]|nr:DMT family transporter [Paracoccaceae bacterium]